MRAFLAIPLPEALQETLAGAARGVRGLRAQRPETIHLTVRFLGDIEDPGAIERAVRPVAEAHPPFEMELRGVGVFPNPRAARVVWVGLGEGEERALALAAAVERALAPLGFTPEARPWSAHITLGRFRDPARVDPALLDPKRPFGRARADRLVLYESVLGREGAAHTPVAEMSLGRAMTPPPSI